MAASIYCLDEYNNLHQNSPFSYIISLAFQKNPSKFSFHSSHFTDKQTVAETCLVQFSSVAQSYLTLCDPMNRSMPGLSVHHQLPESTQTHVHRVSDAIQPSHPLSSPSPPALNLSQHQGLFQ